jgi:Tfp pilus assembly PilM family ATPase
MKSLSFLKSPALYIEIGQTSLRMLDGDDGLELSLERQDNGRLSPACAERLSSSIQVFLKKKSWGARPKAYCAIGSRGVSVRRLELPNAAKDELQRLLHLQIEREFPVPPEELAWGWRALGPKQSGSKTSQEVLVAAVKKDILQDYIGVLAACSITPVFTFGAFARNALISHPPTGHYAILDIGRSHTELTCCEKGIPVSVRVLPWGGENMTQAVQKRLAISHAEAEKLKIHDNGKSSDDGSLATSAWAAMEAEISSLAASVRAYSVGSKIYISGETVQLKDFTSTFSKALENVECNLLDTSSGEGRSAAILGLKRETETNHGLPSLVVETPTTSQKEKSPRPAQGKWAALAVLLLVALFILRYAEPLIQKPRLTRKIAEIKAYRDKLPQVDRELTFLQYLKTNQPPYLDPLALVANSAPQGTRIESLALGRRGDLSVRATFRDFQQVVDFRSKMLNSGYFNNVVVEEQSPSPDRQKMTVRITGQWNPSAESKNLDSILKSNEKPKPAIRLTPARAREGVPAPTTNASVAAPPSNTATIAPRERKE